MIRTDHIDWSRLREPGTESWNRIAQLLLEHPEVKARHAGSWLRHWHAGRTKSVLQEELEAATLIAGGRSGATRTSMLFYPSFALSSSTVTSGSTCPPAVVG